MAKKKKKKKKKIGTKINHQDVKSSIY